MTATINVQHNSRTDDRELNPAIGSSSSYAQSPAIRAKVISLTSALSMVALEKVVYRHDQRKISSATLALRNDALEDAERPHLFPRAEHFEELI
jgi:hypothetical protein